MTVNLFGISLHEFDVAITDLLLFIELIVFAYILHRERLSRTMPGRLITSLFLALGASSFLGSFFHAFFPLKAETAIGLIVWMFVAVSIGAAAFVMSCIDALIFGGRVLLRRSLPAIGLYFLTFGYAILFVDYRFKTIILFYLPPMIMLFFMSAAKFLREKTYAWLGVSVGVILSFVAAGIQYLQISLHPIYFNYNALYHTVQGVGMAVIFLSFRTLLRGNLIAGASKHSK